MYNSRIIAQNTRKMDNNYLKRNIFSSIVGYTVGFINHIIGYYVIYLIKENNINIVNFIYMSLCGNLITFYLYGNLTTEIFLYYIDPTYYTDGLNEKICSYICAILVAIIFSNLSLLFGSSIITDENMTIKNVSEIASTGGFFSVSLITIIIVVIKYIYTKICEWSYKRKQEIRPITPMKSSNKI